MGRDAYLEEEVCYLPWRGHRARGDRILGDGPIVAALLGRGQVQDGSSFIIPLCCEERVGPEPKHGGGAMKGPLKILFLTVSAS